VVAGGVLLALAGCSSTEPTRETATPMTAKDLFVQGHQLYLARSFDSARTALQRAAALDTLFVDPVADLAGLHFDLAMANPAEKSPERMEHVREARRWFAKLEVLGNADDITYQRLCELSVMLGDDRGFARYARRDAERYPYERQYYNLGLAQFGVGDYQAVVKSQKEAIEKFPRSAYLGGFYRQIGRAYMKIGRDQTAERTMETGIRAINDRIAALLKDKSGEKADIPRLREDRIAVLQLLKRLYQTYHEDEKLKNVERLLDEAGATP
jgi:tetratricopeptide (TPR) repeat protein